LKTLDERGLERIFRSLLRTRGLRPIDERTTHGPWEHGKDIIALPEESASEILGFQLKVGDITQGDWVEMERQVSSLQVVPAEIPDIGRRNVTQSFWVCTGELKPTVKALLTALSDRRQTLGYPRIRVLGVAALADLITASLAGIDVGVPGAAELFARLRYWCRNGEFERGLLRRWATDDLASAACADGKAAWAFALIAEMVGCDETFGGWAKLEALELVLYVLRSSAAPALKGTIARAAARVETRYLTTAERVWKAERTHFDSETGLGIREQGFPDSLANSLRVNDHLFATSLTVLFADDPSARNEAAAHLAEAARCEVAGAIVEDGQAVGVLATIAACTKVNGAEALRPLIQHLAFRFGGVVTHGGIPHGTVTNEGLARRWASTDEVPPWKRDVVSAVLLVAGATCAAQGWQDEAFNLNWEPRLQGYVKGAFVVDEDAVWALEPVAAVNIRVQKIETWEDHQAAYSSLRDSVLDVRAAVNLPISAWAASHFLRDRLPATGPVRAGAADGAPQVLPQPASGEQAT